MYEIKAVFKGLVPLMMDRFYDLASLEQATKKKKKTPTDADIKKECKLKLHMDKKGVYVPADNIRMMLIGNQMRMGAAKILGSHIEKNKGTEYIQMCKSCIWVIGLKDPLKVYIEPARKTFDDIDERAFPTLKGKGGCSRKITRRPIINLPWSLSFKIQVTDEQIHENKVRELFDVAGLRCGCCAYGPTFGRCIIDKWEIVK